MATKEYNALEGTLSVRGTATSTRSGADESIALVGGYNSNTAASGVTPNDGVLLDDPSNASETLGDCELSRGAAAASANGVGTVYAVPLAETTTTETTSSAASGTLGEAPIFNPDLHPDHDITVTDTVSGNDVTVTVVYEQSVTTPSEADTMNLNPITGEWAADTASDYDIQYTYGNYTDAIDAAADLDVRYVVVGTEAESVKADLVAALNDIANDFDFKRGVVGARPEIDGGQTGSYTPSQRDWRLVEVAPSLGTGASGPTRSAYAVGGFMAAQPIGPDGSGLYDPVNGLVGLNTAYRASEAKDFSGVTAITRNGTLATTETTSDEGQFRLIYATEIIDEVALDLFNVASDYAGGPQDLGELQTLLEVQCRANTRGSPPNLGFARAVDRVPFDVTTVLGNSDTVSNAGVTIVPYPIAEEVNINMTVADGFVQFEGAN
jgi:hypothetical protein